MRDAGVRMKGQGAAGGRVLDVSAVGPHLTRDGGKNLVEQRRAPALLRHPHHRGLLKNFAAAAKDREGGRGLRAVEKGACFLLDKIAEIRIADRIVEIGD
jgi:hypothetical protein